MSYIEEVDSLGQIHYYDRITNQEVFITERDVIVDTPNYEFEEQETTSFISTPVFVGTSQKRFRLRYLWAAVAFSIFLLSLALFVSSIMRTTGKYEYQARFNTHTDFLTSGGVDNTVVIQFNPLYQNAFAVAIIPLTMSAAWVGVLIAAIVTIVASDVYSQMRLTGTYTLRNGVFGTIRIWTSYIIDSTGHLDTSIWNAVEGLVTMPFIWAGMALMFGETVSLTIWLIGMLAAGVGASLVALEYANMLSSVEAKYEEDVALEEEMAFAENRPVRTLVKRTGDWTRRVVLMPSLPATIMTLGFWGWMWFYIVKFPTSERPGPYLAMAIVVFIFQILRVIILPNIHYGIGVFGWVTRTRGMYWERYTYDMALRLCLAIEISVFGFVLLFTNDSHCWVPFWLMPC